MMQGGTRLLWGPEDRLRLFSKLRILYKIKPMVNFHKYFTSCAAECPDNIYLIQSSDKHNQLMQQGVMLTLQRFTSPFLALWTDVPADPPPSQALSIVEFIL